MSSLREVRRRRKRSDSNRIARFGRLLARRTARAAVDSYRDAFAEAPQAADVAQALERISFMQGWTGTTELEELYLMATTVGSTESIVEIGSYCGRATGALALGTGRRERSVITVDPHTGDINGLPGQAAVLPSTEPVLRYNLALADIESVVTVRVTTSVAAAEAYESPPEVGLLFVDGWHTREAVVADVTAWSPHIARDATVVLDDWDWPGVMSGIQDLERARLLPDRLGAVGRHLVFGSRDRLRQVLPRLRTLAEAADSRKTFLREKAVRARLASSRSRDPAPLR